MPKIAFISDIHGNLPALDAVLKAIRTQGVSKIYCLGDLVGYYCYFNEVVERLQKEEIPCIMGNHDYALVRNKGVIERSKTCTHILKWQLERSSDSTLKFLEGLSDHMVIDHSNKKLFCVHAGLDDHIDEYLFDVNEKYLRDSNFEHDVLISGHTHLPSCKRFYNGKMWINPGSVGQPRDMDNRASYVIMNDIGDIEFHRVKYDYKKVIDKMKEMGFDDYISNPLIDGRKIGA